MRSAGNFLVHLFCRQKITFNQVNRTVQATSFRHSHIGVKNNHQKYNGKKLFIYSAALGTTVVATVGLKKVIAFGRAKEDGLKTFTRKDVALHDTLERGVWITYKGNVYDITDFVKHHPGGTHTIMMGAGGDVEPFWRTYTLHEATEVQNLLSKYKIGILSKEEESSFANVAQDKQDGPYANEPIRSPLLKVLSQEPFNAETPPKLLVQTPITPTEIFFVRNHLPVPEVDIDKFKLEIYLGSDGDLDGQRLLAEFTLEELKSKFKTYTIENVIQCSGNRRSELKKLRDIKGLNWNVGAMGNAKWTGVKFVDVLENLKSKLDEKKVIKHVQFEGLDCDMSGQPYGASISSDVAFDPNKDVLIAFEMNGQPLTRDHGFPLRLIAPGVTGARNVKWLAKIILSHEESNSHWQRNDYKSFSPNADMFNIDYSRSISIQEMPVQSAICDPTDGDIIKLQLPESSAESTILPVKGYAYSGGGKMIVRVDVSTDGGTSWMTANLMDTPKQENGLPDYTDRNRVGSWTRWSLDLPIPPDILKDKNQPLEILCRAFDSAYNSQPERPETIWNVRGVVNNSWHKIRVKIQTD